MSCTLPGLIYAVIAAATFAGALVGTTLAFTTYHAAKRAMRSVRHAQRRAARSAEMNAARARGYHRPTIDAPKPTGPVRSPIEHGPDGEVLNP